MHLDENHGCFVAAVAAFLLAFFGFCLFSASQEAAAYNRLTGGNATTWDAMWVELRVDSGAASIPGRR